MMTMSWSCQSPVAIRPLPLKRTWVCLSMIAVLALFALIGVITVETPEPKTLFELMASKANSLNTRWPDGRRNNQTVIAGCEHFPDTSNILTVMKTGATESYSKVPTHLLTNLRCVNDFLIFGDMEQTVGGHKIQDGLDNVDPQAKVNNPEFDIYNRQKQCPIDQKSCNENRQNLGAEAWTLAKYQNIHMAEKAYRQRPGYDWYLFIDADTYVIWPTMVEYLKRLDPAHTYYVGSASMYAGVPFAHGGSGYFISGALMKEFFDGKMDVARKWDLPARTNCCGDVMLAYAFKEALGVPMMNLWPTINGEMPFTIPYGPEQWCNPIMTMHHIESEQISNFDNFERSRNFSSPMRIKDIYHHFVEPLLRSQTTRMEWDNMSNDVLYFNKTEGEHSDQQLQKLKQGPMVEQEANAHLSLENCQKLCHDTLNTCVQYSWNAGICAVSNTIKMGRPRLPEGENGSQWKSGWCLDKIDAWVKANDDCGMIDWPTPGVIPVEGIV